MKTQKVDNVLTQYADAGREALIPVLQELQDLEGYLSRETVSKVADRLKLPASKIYGVATFYNQFRFRPRGKYHFIICRGTACHVKGSFHILKMLIEQLGIQPGETSRDKMFSLETVACMGACGLAPVLNLNGEFHAQITPKKLLNIIKKCREGIENESK